jgi:hypothetical protein
MPKRTISACLCSLLCLFLAAPGSALASAADPKIEDHAVMAAAQKKKVLSVEVKAGVVGMAEVENGPAEMGYSDFRVTAKYKGFDVGYELRNYRWGRTDNLPFAPGWQDPFNNMHTVRVGYERTGRINPKWGWRAYGRLSSSFENDILGSPTALLGAGLSYAATRNLIVMAGLFGSYNEADQFLLPFAGLIYRPGATDGFSGSLGFPFSRLNYHMTKKADPYPAHRLYPAHLQAGRRQPGGFKRRFPHQRVQWRPVGKLCHHQKVAGHHRRGLSVPAGNNLF